MRPQVLLLQGENTKGENELRSALTHVLEHDQLCSVIPVNHAEELDRRMQEVRAAIHRRSLLCALIEESSCLERSASEAVDMLQKESSDLPIVVFPLRQEPQHSYPPTVRFFKPWDPALQEYIRELKADWKGHARLEPEEVPGEMAHLLRAHEGNIPPDEILTPDDDEGKIIRECMRLHFLIGSAIEKEYDNTLSRETSTPPEEPHAAAFAAGVDILRKASVEEKKSILRPLIAHLRSSWGPNTSGIAIDGFTLQIIESQGEGQHQRAIQQMRKRLAHLGDIQEFSEDQIEGRILSGLLHYINGFPAPILRINRFSSERKNNAAVIRYLHARKQWIPTDLDLNLLEPD